MPNNDKDIKIGIGAEVDKKGFEEGDRSVEEIRKGIDGLSDEVERLNSVLKEGSGKLGDLAMSGDANSEEAEALRKKMERAANTRDRMQDALNREQAALKAALAKDKEAEATRKLSEAEKDLEESSRKRIEQNKEAAKDAEVRGTPDTGSSDLATLARGGAYVAAISAAVGGANALLQDFNQQLVGAGINLEKLRETNPGDFVWVDTLNAISNPLDTIKSKLLEIAGIDGLKKSAEQAARMETSMDKALVQMERWQQADNAARLGKLYEERRAVDEITAALRRRFRLEESVRGLQETKARATDEAAIAGGADPNLVAAQAAARQMADDLTRLNQDIVLAKQNVTDAILTQEQARDELLRVMGEFTADSPEVQEARTALSKARAAVDQAKLDAATTEQIAKDSAAAITTSTQAAMTGLAREAEQSITSEVDKTIGLIEAKAKEQGGRLSSGAKQSLENLDKIITDKIPDAQQVDAILTQFQTLQSTTEARNGAFGETLRSISQAIEKEAENVRAVLSEVNVVQQNQDRLTGEITATRAENSRLTAKINQLSGR